MYFQQHNIVMWATYSFIQRLVKHQDFSKRLPDGWKNKVDERDHNWIGQQVFSAKGVLAPSLKLWWHPPPIPGPDFKGRPEVGSYFHIPLLLWMPKRMWSYDFKCPTVGCQASLNSKGVYRQVRKVVNLKDHYYLAGEYHQCSKCTTTCIAWDARLLEQLPASIRNLFSVIMTYKFACDRSVVNLMRSRTAGNSATALCNNVRELHSEEWLWKSDYYVSACERHMDSRNRLGLPSCTYDNGPVYVSPPGVKWFMATHIRDIYFRLPWLKACATSVFGTILKVDSTKKITRKLQVSGQAILL